jgi:glycosyltransferase involved in cell wall biosynthesis
MRINWIGFYQQYGGYGRLSSRIVQAMQTFGLDVKHMTIDDIDKPEWMLRQQGVDWSNLTITCTQPRGVLRIPGRHWLFTMCEGELLSKYCIDIIHKSGVERLIVPCEHNKKVFLDSGLKLPISVVPLGTDPDEFPLHDRAIHAPYTFLTIADRGNRKGWMEVFDAFYKAFGGKTTGRQDVCLIIKMLERGNPLINLIQDKGSSLDHRIIYNSHKYESMADLYSLADCVVLPSRSEGWGMPHREAAMMGLPVITQKYAGTDDGHTEEWAIVLPEGRMEPIPKNGRTGGSGNWMIADTRRLAEEMYECYENPERVSVEGLKAREWLSNNQTWMHSAAGLIELVHDQIGWDYGIAMESSSRRSLAESGRAVYEGCRFVG